MFDVRCLPNPHWEASLQPQTGRDPAVVQFLEQFDSVGSMLGSIRSYLDQWVPAFRAEDRAYLTVSVGCTGGRHRSVYIIEQLYGYFTSHTDSVSLRHRELNLTSED